jgi:DnaK suppressor protein
MPDEYLNNEEMITLKAILDEQMDALLSKSRAAVAELTSVNTVEADPLDAAVQESNREFTLRLADRERRLLAKIRYAVARIKTHEYGSCESCGEPITYGRLLARPVATLCIDCKTEAEQVEKPRRVF